MTGDMQPIQIHFLSARSIYVETISPGGSRLSSATAFLVKNRDNQPFLVTNRHVVTGRHQETGDLLSATGATPERLFVAFPVRGSLGSWMETVLPLLDADGRPVWLEHPDLGSRADVVVWAVHGDVASLDLGMTHQVYHEGQLPLQPASELQVIGFPIGVNVRRDGAFGIWCRGTVASEPGIELNGLPCFLIDSRTREGQSGSPVVAHATGGWRDPSGTFVVGGERAELVGVYSGRIHRESDLGMVWRVTVVRDLIERGVRPSSP